MTTMFKTINDHADAVRAQKERELAAMNAKRKNAPRKKATRAFLLRAIPAWLLVIALWAAVALDFTDWFYVWYWQVAAMLWFMGWLGAWIQFMFCKEGLLK